MTDTTIHTPADREPPLEAASTPSARPINSSHVIATGSSTALLAGVIQWASSWPLKSLDAATASDLAGLIVLIVGGVIAAYKSKMGSSKT